MMESNETKNIEKSENKTELKQTTSQTIKSSADQIKWEDLDFLDEDPTNEDGKIIYLNSF